MKLKRIVTIFEKNIIVIIASLGIFLSPFIVDYSDLPKGFELPKVLFWQIFAGIIIAIGLIKYFEKLLRAKKFTFSKDILIVGGVILISIVSTFLSSHQEIAIAGNSFRDQGLITHVLIFLMIYVVYKSATPRNFHLLAIAFVFSSFIQSIIAYTQFYDLFNIDPQLILEGYWVNGSFGQANFFSGRLLLGIIFAVYYLGKTLSIKFAWLVKILLTLVVLSITLALLISLSIWGIIVGVIALILTFLYELLPKRIFLLLLLISLVYGAAIGSYLILNNTTYNQRIDIWSSILQVFSTDPDKSKLILGYGFDTLGHVFRDAGRFSGLFIDRAHNFFLDIFFESGIIVLGVVGVLILRPVVALKSKISNRKFFFIFLALLIWLIRSFIHESGVVNLVDFGIILAFALALSKKDKLKHFVL